MEILDHNNKVSVWNSQCMQNFIKIKSEVLCLWSKIYGRNQCYFIKIAFKIEIFKIYRLLILLQYNIDQNFNDNGRK